MIVADYSRCSGSMHTVAHTFSSRATTQTCWLYTEDKLRVSPLIC